MEKRVLRILCDNLMKAGKEPCLEWLVGAPFMPFTIISSLKCLHTDGDPFTPDYTAEAEDLQVLLPRGLEVIGALFISDTNYKENALRAGDILFRLRRCLLQNESSCMIGAAATVSLDNIHFFMYVRGKNSYLEAFESVVHEEKPTQYLWDIACLLQCQMSLRLPVYLSSNRSADNEEQLSLVIDEVAASLRGPRAVFMAERAVNQSEEFSPVLLRCTDLNVGGAYKNIELLESNIGNSNSDSLLCSNLGSIQKFISSASGVKIPEPINITVLQQSSDKLKAGAPTVEYFPAKEDIRLIILTLKLDVLCLTSKELSLAGAVSKLLIPGLIDQLTAIKKAGASNIRMRQPHLCAYHFCPPGLLHPVTAIYDITFGESEMKQVDIRLKLHVRLKLPLDRPLIRVANSLTLTTKNVVAGGLSSRKGSKRLSNVHVGLSSSGVAGGQMSLIEGYYEYYHYLQDDFDDNGWGCAYRSLQTIISWFALQHYTSVEVPSHRKIQETLVEIGDKEPSFIGSREWIGAIELSFVLDKLLGVSCKILNVRSGAELPEKCRELALHFEMQGTPVMIGGGVLAYSLLGVDYNELTGDSAFLILDPHYTGADDLNSIQAGGWCGWKKAVSNKGKEFFLRDKFYNLLLPQRPNMV